MPRMCCVCCHVLRMLCSSQDLMDCLIDIREHDVPYHTRFAIDADIRCGHWFTVRCKVSCRLPPILCCNFVTAHSNHAVW